IRTLLDNSLVEAVLINTLNDPWHKAIEQDRPNYILRSYLARNNLVPAPMHIDSYIPYTGEHPLSIQVSLVLEPQDESNGCTVLVPGSHQSGKYTQQEARSEAVPVTTEAGDIVFWDSRIWHGTCANHSGGSRWSLIGTFVRWWIKQGYQITQALPRTFYRELTDSQRAVLGYCSIPFMDESEGIDFKTGYSDLE
ncbi:MAG: phytanoyl-CoA dioxygenase family protein, partial [Gammaproteobacteria bacterium]